MILQPTQTKTTYIRPWSPPAHSMKSIRCPGKKQAARSVYIDVGANIGNPRDLVRREIVRRSLSLPSRKQFSAATAKD